MAGYAVRARARLGLGDIAGAQRDAATLALAAIEALKAPAVRCYMLRFPSAVRLRGRPRYDRLVAGCPEASEVR
jgi:hypothetical protein